MKDAIYRSLTIKNSKLATKIEVAVLCLLYSLHVNLQKIMGNLVL